MLHELAHFTGPTVNGIDDTRTSTESPFKVELRPELTARHRTGSPHE
jgi:hypothetical protein